MSGFDASLDRWKMADATLKTHTRAVSLFLLTCVCSKVYKPYIFLIDNSEESLTPAGSSAIPNPKRTVLRDVARLRRSSRALLDIQTHRALRVWNRALLNLDLSSSHYYLSEIYRVHIL